MIIMSKIKLNNKVYDIMKYILWIFVPALVTLIEGLGLLYDFDPSLIVATITLVSTFLGSIAGISSYNYYKGKK